jgi:hypothetical protein
MKDLNLYLYIIVFIALVLPLSQIYKYGLSGYYEKKIERKQQRGQQMINLFT